MRPFDVEYKRAIFFEALFTTWRQMSEYCAKEHWETAIFASKLIFLNISDIITAVTIEEWSNAQLFVAI